MSSISCGIVGLPNVGKSTLFNALTKNNVLAANYPFATIEPNVGIVGVPDKRLAKLAEIYHPDKVTPATVTFVDIAGIVRGASQGQGLGNKFLAHIREADAIVQVVRAFSDNDVIHVDGRIDPKADIETVRTELILADLQTLDNRVAKAQGDAKRGGAAADYLKKLEHIRGVLDKGHVASTADVDLEEFADLNLLTAKPFVYVFNMDEDNLVDQEAKSKLATLVAPAPAIFLSAKLEAELAELPDEDAAELLHSLDLEGSGLNQLAAVGFKTLGLQTYLTAGPKEVRAWTIPQGATAPEAAGVIHTDFQKGFIKAEIVNYTDLTSAGSVAAAKAQGKVRLEGKDYIMRDGDVVEFRFNV